MSITPDTKNWTWVLERPCPECGFDSRAFDVRATGTIVRDLADRFVGLLESDADLATRPAPGKWSPLEYGCHVRDSMRVFSGRVSAMLTEDDPAFANWDQDATAVEEDYASQDPRVVAVDLRAEAGTFADRYDAVPDDAWQRTGRRSDGSTFTVETLARYFVHDPVHHWWDVTGEPADV